MLDHMPDMSNYFDCQKTSRQMCLAHVYQWLRVRPQPEMSPRVADSHNILFEVGNNRYVARDTNNVNIKPPFPRPPRSLRLITVIQCDETLPIEKTWLETYLRDASKADDVFCPAFVQGLILISGSNRSASIRIQLTQEAQAYLRSIGNQWLQVLSSYDVPKGVDPGVYYLSGVDLKRVFRLYDDVNKVFLTTLEPRTSAR